jgi:hypothetical protein
MPKFLTARFHVLTGPPELFRRVRFKMQDVRLLKTHARHVQDRSYERDAPLDRLQNFDPSRWRLMTAEVRTDKGKFVNTAWSVEVDGQEWWVVIGFDATMKTVIRAARGKLALGPDVIRTGELYDFVASVNAQLMADDLGPERGLMLRVTQARSMYEVNPHPDAAFHRTAGADGCPARRDAARDRSDDRCPIHRGASTSPLS